MYFKTVNYITLNNAVLYLDTFCLLYPDYGSDSV